MKAISLWQPWASLWATVDAKLHETRSWPTKHRGELAIHAAKRNEEVLFGAAAVERRIILGTDPLPRGAIIAVVTLDDCYPTDGGSDQYLDQLFGNWEPSRFAWRRGPVIHVLQNPITARGFQGIWRLTAEQEEAVRAQIAPATSV